MQKILPPAGKCDCPKCGGYPELDEDGRAYTCYFCEDTGYVDAAVAEAYWRDRTDEVEYVRPTPVVGGKHLVARFDRVSGDAWDEELPLLPAGLIRQASIAARAAARELAVTVDVDDDLPF